MKETMRKKLSWEIGLLVCILVLLLINIVMTTKLSVHNQKSQPSSVQREPLPCKAIPVRFILDEPICADKLLQTMNVTNLHILPKGALNQLLNRTSFRSQNLSEENK